MNRTVRAIAVAGLTAAVLTVAFVGLRGGPLRSIAPLTLFVSAPAVLLSVAAFQWIQHINSVSPALYSIALTHFRLISASVFFVATFFWIAGLFSPVLFGFRIFRLSCGASQTLALFIGAIVTMACLYIFVLAMPHAS
jgi:hypothetical protein